MQLARGGVEQVPHEKVALDYKNILSFSPSEGISRQRVLIEGVPGSGKSTLVQRMCHEWTVGCFAQDYEVVVQVTLRSLPKDQKLNLEDLIFTSVGDPGTVQEVADSITAHQGQGVLFMFDGFDELSEDMRENSLVRDIIEGRCAPQSSFVVTTRPISAENLYHCVDRRVEISGFGEKEVKEYITESDLRQRLESNFLLDAFLPALYLENVLTDYEFKQLLPIPQPALVDRNRKFLDYLANKNPTTVSDTLSILFRPEYEPYGHFGEMLQQLFDVDRKGEEGMRGKTSRKSQQGGERGNGAKKVSTLWSSYLTSTGVVCNGLFLDGLALARTAVLVGKVM